MHSQYLATNTYLHITYVLKKYVSNLLFIRRCFEKTVLAGKHLYMWQSHNLRLGLQQIGLYIDRCLHKFNRTAPLKKKLKNYIGWKILWNPLVCEKVLLCKCFPLNFVKFFIPVDTGRKLNVHKTYRRRPGRRLNVLRKFNLRPVSTGSKCFLQSTYTG